ncbi:hypothetical protein ASG01_04405 [Chryseobacterium sp. Leaf180]|uniref:energy transducer TonB n=1 Tax=Chryseobacterium sp. Leaf180 TaxID=1736289 RepID=UPI0006F66D9D|nr:energy transducer TonB [Chryseobacterium sp. Leaf180]KQR95105.1 hypothetical protein ASG01_04405 [Chryseobacterium sp. Leaf180]
MIKKTLGAILLFAAAFSQAQILDQYHRNNDFYYGGEAQFFKDFHKIAIEKNIQPCENKNEIYMVKLIIDEKGEIKYVRDDDNINASQSNKCAYDMGLKVLKYMNKFKPLMINGEKVQSMASFYLIPDALLENFNENFILIEKVPAYKGLPGGGIMQFRKDIVSKIYINDFKWNKDFRLEVIFTVNTDGIIQNVNLEESSGVPEFDRRIISAVQNLKKKWTPATINNIPVRYRFRLPLKFGV